MAAPTKDIVWGSRVGDYGQIGIYTGVTTTNTQVTIYVQTWFRSKYSVTDSSNSYYFNNLTAAGSATTKVGSVSIKTTNDSGSGWSTSNEVKLGESTFTYDRGTSNSTRYFYAKLTGVDRVGGTMYASATVSIPKLATFTVSYDKNGGSTTPSSVTKYYGKDITVASAISRNGYSFKNWNTKKDGSGTNYGAGSKYSANANATLYAQWTPDKYTVTYNPNGGNLGNVSATQTKTHDVNLTLDTDKPTRTNYNFLGWSTSKSATTAQYDPGDLYITNSSITLYAVWQLAYEKPRITNFSIFRCDSSGVASDNGTCAHIKLDYECDQAIESITIAWAASSGKNGSAIISGDDPVAGSVDVVIGENGINDMLNEMGDQNAAFSFSTETTYTFTLTIRDGDGDHYSAVAATLSGSSYIIDFKDGGKGVALGKAAELDGVFDVALTSRFLGNHYCMSSPGKAGSAGYVLVAKIDITDANADTPITFVITQRTAATPMTVHIRFSNPTATASSLATIKYEGSNYKAYLVHIDALEWYLYVQKVSAYDTITVQDWYTSKSMDSRIKVTFPGTFVDDMPQGLDGWYRATPAVLQSIIDCLLPVGMIIHLYSHADPNSMYPGTTWVRLTNTFLWACDANGDIGITGGEKTHTLTVNELPKHTHGSVYSGNASGTKNYAWLSSGGSAMAYGAVETGGGAAHNNMPPYVQVSIWRRTA